MAGVSGRSGVYHHQRAPVCRRGHPTEWRQNSTRWGRCVTCDTERMREYRARQKALREALELARVEDERRRAMSEAEQQRAAADWERRMKEYTKKLRDAEVEAIYEARRCEALNNWARRVRGEI